ncbi:hypothetical protein [Tengunoibacter tsumagoiensis]|uniref:PsbP C-terminal domain-containing protein n=1 Tax=Tengunoibacter tsumagoiensis TaxID=2014871 RepID=A0A402A119_9CHLR|nr:hypothetical protein [Tengunoibacter tsumagoiensis]GCE12711.1 hypothetical protein KTT_25700 [Tengunoibacter tsumagoiensis]
MQSFFSSFRWTVLLLSCLCLTFALSACDLFGSNATAKPTPTPTQASINIPGTGNLKTYQGDGFTLKYPEGWKVTEDQKFEEGRGKAISFTDPTGLVNFTVDVAPNPGALLSANSILDLAVNAFKSNAKNYQAVNVSAKTTVGGQSWDQRGATADVTVKGITASSKEIAIAVNYPAQSANTKVYGILYATATAGFDLANAAYFQPILQSFKFTN